MSFHYNADSSYFFVNGKEIFKFKAKKENVNFPTKFCLRSISLKGNADNFSFKYNFIDKFNIIMVKPTIIDMNPVEIKYYLFTIGLNKCSGSCTIILINTCVPKKQKA